jgi:3-deoxy-D-manno-octulosonate 8-phosphate phosphatase (KDO 8-P phosphatase)
MPERREARCGTYWSKAALIRLVIFDVDGVLTDGRLYLGNDGNEFKAFHIRDGHGIKMLLDAGVEVAIISGRHAASVERRMSDLGIRHAYLGVQDKLSAFDGLLARLGLTADQSRLCRRRSDRFAGHDPSGFGHRRAGRRSLRPAARPLADPHRGGRGAARDVCELLLEARGQLAALRGRYL